MANGAKILSVGASGRYAGLVAKALAARGAHVRGMVHRAESTGVARDNGVAEVIVADLDDPESLLAAASGMDGVFYIGPEFKRNESQQGKNMVEAAKRAGVRKYVYSAVQHPFIDAMVNHKGKLPVMQAVIESGLEFTILLPTTFMQFIEYYQWDNMLRSGVYLHPIRRDAMQSYVDYRDVAEAAALALTTDGLGWGIFELAAGGMLSNIELVEKIGKVLGRTIAVADPSFAEYTRGIPVDDDYVLKGYAAICDWYSKHGFPGGNNLSLRTILGREPRSIDAYLKELAARKPTI